MNYVASDRDKKTARYGWKSKLHFAWALAAAFAAGSIAVILALWDWCAFDRGGCLAAEPIGQMISLNVVYLLFGGLIAAGILASAPWTRHVWARLSFGACFGVGVVVAGCLFMIATSGGAEI